MSVSDSVSIYVHIRPLHDLRYSDLCQNIMYVWVGVCLRMFICGVCVCGWVGGWVCTYVHVYLQVCTYRCVLTCGWVCMSMRVFVITSVYPYADMPVYIHTVSCWYTTSPTCVSKTNLILGKKGKKQQKPVFLL